MSSRLVRLEQLSRSYGAVTALHPVDLSVAAGARHAIIGPNGAGKSTLLHLIAGSIPASRGRIVFDERDITRTCAAARADLGIARTFQHPAICEYLSVADNVALAIRRRTLQTTPPGTRRRAVSITAALDRVGLADLSTTPARQLSYGQQRMLELAVVLAAQPRLLLLDEPSAGLDPAGIRQLAAIIDTLGDDVTVILVDHHLPLVWHVADTVTVLASGQHIATGPTTAIRANPDVAAAYLTCDTAVGRTPRTGTLTPALAVDTVTAGYHGAPVLDRISLTVDAGTVHALLGRNGAGKSTLVNVLAGLHPAQPGGQIRLGDHDLRPGRAAWHGVALVPQGRRLFASLTVGEHLRMAAAGRARTTTGRVSFDVPAVYELLPALAGKEHRYPGQMSGGEQQMLALARALLQQPRLLLLDEPSEGLAPRIVDQIADLITRIADTGVAVLLAEQNQHLARTVADRFSVLDAGRIAFTTTDLDQPATQTRLSALLGVATTGSTL